jgi:hypothetical protein
MTNNERNERKSQGLASATSAVPPTNKESGNRKGVDKKKVKPGKLAHSAGQGR